MVVIANNHRVATLGRIDYLYRKFRCSPVHLYTVLIEKPNVVMNLFREIRDFCRFFWKTPKREKEIVFYSEHEGYYPTFEGLITELTGKHKRTLCYVTSDLVDPILQKAELGIKTFYLNKLLAFFMAFVDCKVFVMTLSGLNQSYSYLKRSVNPVHYVFVPHFLISTHLTDRYGAFDDYDSVLCGGPHHIKEIRKHEELNGLKPKRLLEAGYYRLERIYQAYQKYSPKKSSSANRGTILIAPSWPKRRECDTLKLYGERLVDIILEAGYQVIVRPHPETVRRSPRLISLLISKFGNHPNFTLETSITTDDSLLKADVLISDYSGIALEYAFGTERPVLFLDVPLEPKNPRFKELGIEPLELSLRSKIGVIVSPEKLDTVPQVISELIANSVLYKERIAKLRQQYVYAFGHSSDIGAKHIFDLATKRQNSKEGVAQ